MSWYDLWNNWLNTTLRVVYNCPIKYKRRGDYNQNNVGLYFFKNNSQGNKNRYHFGRIPHFEHKIHWMKKHRGRRNFY
jgi:hypothetical protein